MTKKIIILLLIIIAVLTFIIAIISVKQPNHIVTKVIDGDTFTLTSGEKVRLIGIDTPEKGEYYYNESKEALTELIFDKIISLEKDTSETDRYNRLLRYVYVDGDMVNLYLVSNGYARAVEYAPDLRYAEEFKQAENDAKSNNLGIWFETGEGDELCISLGCPAGTNYVGSKNSNKYHECDSRFARMISPDNIICFASESDALDSGYSASN